MSNRGITFSTGGDFEPCPNFEGTAVCCDVTPLKAYHSEEYGTSHKFQIVFEMDFDRDDAPEGQCTRWCVWSSLFSPTLGDRANFRKFLEDWLGHGLSAEEIRTFSSESLIGRNAHVVVEQKEQKSGKIRSEIVLIRPPRGEKLKLSGTFTRKADREDGGDDRRGGGGDGGSRKGASYKTTGGGGANKNEPRSDRAMTIEEAAKFPEKVKCHIGKAAGHPLGSLDRSDIEVLIEKFLRRDFKGFTKPTMDDQRLAAALQTLSERFSNENDDGDGGDGAEPEEHQRATSGGGRKVGSDY